MFATSLALIAQAFHGRERGTAFGIFGAVTGAAVAAGPLIGGVITSAIGWEWIFFVNVPIGIAAVALTLSKVDESRDPQATGVDWAGLVTFSGSLFLLVFALVRGNTLGWGSTQIVAMLSASVLLLVAFVVAERLQTRPMLDLSLFKRPAFAGASLVAFTLSSSAFAMFLYLTLYIQDVLHYSPLQAGLRFLPTTLLMFAVSPLAGKLSVRVPIRLLLGVGLLFVSGGLLAMTAITPTASWTALIPGFVLQGIGVGLINPPLASAAIGVVPAERSGMASGANSTFRHRHRRARRGLPERAGLGRSRGPARQPGGVRRRVHRHPGDRRGGGVRRRVGGVRAGALQGLRDLAGPRRGGGRAGGGRASARAGGDGLSGLELPALRRRRLRPDRVDSDGPHEPLDVLAARRQSPGVGLAFAALRPRDGVLDQLQALQAAQEL